MTRRMLFLTPLLSTLLLCGTAAAGETVRENSTTTDRSEAGQQLSCLELDQQLATLEPQTYSDNPEFYSDPIQGTALWVGTLWTPAWAYLGYTGYKEHQQQGRMADAEAKMEHLRKLKALRHCYER